VKKTRQQQQNLGKKYATLAAVRARKYGLLHQYTLWMNMKKPCIYELVFTCLRLAEKQRRINQMNEAIKCPGCGEMMQESVGYDLECLTGCGEYGYAYPENEVLRVAPSPDSINLAKRQP
jgi:hypothetical protein